MLETKQETCASRIKGQLDYMENIVKNWTELDELALCVETKKETTITFSYGGPADYLHITHDDGEVLRVVYRFSDWFDTATIELDESSPLWGYAEQVIETL